MMQDRCRACSWGRIQLAVRRFQLLPSAKYPGQWMVVEPSIGEMLVILCCSPIGEISARLLFYVQCGKAQKL